MNKQLKRQQREKNIILGTIELLSEHGFLDLKMADIAKVSECSMGVVYSHFASKEDLLVGCAVEVIKKHQRWINELSHTTLDNREKLLVMPFLGWESSAINPSESEVIQMACLPSIWKRASNNRVLELTRVGAETERSAVPIFTSALNVDAEKGKHFLCGIMGLTFGLREIDNSGFGMIEANSAQLSSSHPFIDALRRYCAGWGFDFPNDESEWRSAQETARQIIHAVHKGRE
ncbi:TetR/AcrR family transcriptional regulator [Thaumasiovibrio sp. DFM-14]|uniref:TetR/AcrR family transcriptional regulator n=1 Tax=Thaumasiovibrio sp. DFM-14 TaxID=3384792 RepID=UPI0039A25748